MRIGFLADSFLPTIGGAETVLHNLATRLTRNGDDVLVLAPHIRQQNNQLDVPYAVRRFSRPSSKHFGVSQVMLPLVWHHWQHRFDVLHCNSAYPAAYLGSNLKSWTNLPVVVRPHGDDILPNQRICRHPRLGALVKRALCHADAVVAQGQYMRRVILDFGVPDERIHVIHNGVDCDMFAAGDAFPHRRPYFLAMGSLFRRKGFDLLIEAFAHVRNSDVDLLIAGDGPELNRLKELAQSHHISERVRFLGPVTGQEKVNLLKSAMFLVAPSRCEPFSNVILEGLASGLPVIASNIDGNPEMVIHGRNGMLFPCDSIEALTAAIEQLLDSPAELSRLRNGVLGSVQRFDWKNIAQEYSFLYRHVASNCAVKPRVGYSWQMG